ncbi:MAG TPA: hypothetical protein VF824_18860 [Thermoanaerobaculia bacterium]
MKVRSLFVLAAAFTLAAPLFAQPRGVRAPHTFGNEVRIQGYLFGNFFQATNPRNEEDVTAFGAEYRAAYRPWTTPTDLYAHVDYINYDDPRRRDSYGGRLGVAYNGEIHALNAYVDRAENRATFDVGDVTATANVTTLGADYSFRVTPNWQLGALGEHQVQRFSVRTGQENTYDALGANVRYRGFGRKFSPEVGYVTGTRDVDDPNESYDDDYWYVQLAFAPLDKWNARVRFRDRTRSYTTNAITARNFGREDNRLQWMGAVDYRMTRRLTLTGYYTMEDVDTTRLGGDFDTSMFLLGVTIGF